MCLTCLQASKAALISLYESLRIEFGSDIGITIVTPGLVKSEMTSGELRSKVSYNSMHFKKFQRLYGSN